MNDVDLSVIIPLYKGKEYIENTVNSILPVSCEKEILVIDDGSPDDSYEYCKRIFGCREEVVVIRKPNGGIVDTRNYGLKMAKGRYVMFSDHDDIVHADVVSDVVCALKYNDADFAIWSTDRLLEDRRTIPCDTVKTELLYNRKRIVHSLICEMLTNSSNTNVTYLGHIWAGIYKKDVIDRYDLIFKKYVDIEDDYLFVFDFLLHSRTGLAFPKVGYSWRYNTKSETYRLKYIDNVLTRYKSLYKYMASELKGIGITKEEYAVFKKYAIQNMIVMSVENCFTILNGVKTDRRYVYYEYKHNRELFDQPVYDYQYRRKRIFYLLKYRLFGVAGLYVWLDSLYRRIKGYN